MKIGKVGVMKLTNGEYGEKKAKELWPELMLTKNGGIDDKNGIDAYLYGRKIQIKYDNKIQQTGNIYVELYEKSINRTDQPWRTSKVNADNYIFVTVDKAYLVSVNDLAVAVKNLSNSNELKCKAISDTSIGFLIPISKIKIDKVKIFNPTFEGIYDQ